MKKMKSNTKNEQMKKTIKTGIKASLFCILIACAIKDRISIGFAVMSIIYTLFVLIKNKYYNKG